jgi:glutathione S-transferase
LSPIGWGFTRRRAPALDQGFSVADAYAFYTLRNLKRLDATVLDQSLVLKPYYDRIAARPAVRAALEAEGLS